MTTSGGYADLAMRAASGAVLVGCLAAILFTAAERRWPRAFVPTNWPRVSLMFVLFVANSIVAVGIGILVPSASPAAWLWILAFFLSDFLRYWMHRGMHAHPLLWRFHRFHHAQTQVPTWWHTWALHPVDHVLHVAAGLAPYLLLGISPHIWLWAAVLQKLWSHLLHANLRWRMTAVAALCATPAFHRGHHEVLRGNYATLFPVWDSLFGTRARGA